MLEASKIALPSNQVKAHPKVTSSHRSTQPTFFHDIGKKLKGNPPTLPISIGLSSIFIAILSSLSKVTTPFPCLLGIIGTFLVVTGAHLTGQKS